MFSTLEQKTIEHIDIVKLLINVHAETAKEQESSFRHKVKAYAVSSCVTRLYAIYENFIETAISDYLDAVSEFVSFSSLPEGFKNEYRIGISYLLSKIDQGRYGHLTHENIVKWYYEALNDSKNYKFVTDALIRHEQNFRLNIVENIFNKVQLSGLRDWLESHPAIQELYPDENSVSEQLESEIKDFVQLRNDASHGLMDNLEGDENLNRICDVISSVVRSISSFLDKSLLLSMDENGVAKKLGVVTESFGENGAFVAQVELGTSFEEGEKLYFVDGTNCYSQIIESIMINDVKVNQTVANKNDFEVGIKCMDRVKRNTSLYR